MPYFSNSDTLALRSMDAAAGWPLSSASSSAVAEPPRRELSLALCFRLDPASMRSLRHSVDPFAAAACRGEYPPRISDFFPATARPGERLARALRPVARDVQRRRPERIPRVLIAPEVEEGEEGVELVRARRLVQRRVPGVIRGVHVGAALADEDRNRLGVTPARRRHHRGLALAVALVRVRPHLQERADGHAVPLLRGVV